MTKKKPAAKKPAAPKHTKPRELVYDHKPYEGEGDQAWLYDEAVDCEPDESEYQDGEAAE